MKQPTYTFPNLTKGSAAAFRCFQPSLTNRYVTAMHSMFLYALRQRRGASLLLAAILTTLLPARADAQGDVESRPQIIVTDASINAGDVVRWTAANVYVLDGVVIIEDGAELYIDAGTVVKAETGTGTNASALVITRGGKIVADGTAARPIIFTSVLDLISSPDLLTYEDRGLWGGIVILGHAGTNNPGDATGDYKEIEGINEILPDGDTRAEYGGSDDGDNSGVMRYVSIRHTGINIGESDGNEIQGLTLGGVGRGTTLEYIEAFASGDDGVEFFGGTVDLKYFVSAFNSDDAVDWDQGWRGRGQFWFVLQGTDKAGAAAEMDGAGGDEHFEPYAIPTIYNVTYVGAGVGNQPESDQAQMLIFRDNTGGFYHNSIFTDFQSSEGGYAIRIEDVDNTGSKTEDSRKRFEAGDLGLTHNLFWAFGQGSDPRTWINAGMDTDFRDDIFDYLALNDNLIEDPALRHIERSVTPEGMLDPRPRPGGVAYTMKRARYPDGDMFFTHADFVGAFGRANWMDGWSALDHLGYLDRPDEDVESRPIVVINDSSIGVDDTLHWTADNVYELDGLVIVEEGAQLHVEAGTVVKARDGVGTSASALVVARGGKLFAEGTATQPIIFTSVQDNISSVDLLTYEDRGLWGGIVLLGYAITNNPGDGSGDYKEIEGVNEILPDGDTRAEYGGMDDEDSSGIMRFVSIRHTGINVGESDGNEIQGLTLGGVGRGTTLEHIEAYASGDDGVEFFGGSVGLRYFVSAFNADDAIDWDQGWRGTGQFWFVLQGIDKAGASAEMDGAGGDEHFEPYAIPTIFNATYVGPGVGNQPESDQAQMLIFRDNTGGFYHNSIFTDFQTSEGGYAIRIEDVDNTGSKTEDSRKRFEAGDLGLTHNIFWAFGAGSDPAGWINAGGDVAFQAAIFDYMVTNHNDTVDPMLRGIERGPTGGGMLDPRPAGDSPALSHPTAPLPGDPFFTPAPYIGAFGRTNWTRGWTALDNLGYNGDIAVSIESGPPGLPQGISLQQNYPNPFNPTTTITFSVEHAQHVHLAVYDVLGRQVRLLHDAPTRAGTFQVVVDGQGLASGLYLYRLNTRAGSITRRMALIK